MEGLNLKKEQTTETGIEKTMSAQEVLVPIYEERLDPENVLNYMFEKNKYSFSGLGERVN